jgi:hypothetical protein
MLSPALGVKAANAGLSNYSTGGIFFLSGLSLCPDVRHLPHSKLVTDVQLFNEPFIRTMQWRRQSWWVYSLRKCALVLFSQAIQRALKSFGAWVYGTVFILLISPIAVSGIHQCTCL